MIPIQTSLTKLLGIESPIVSAPMAGASGGALAAQVTLAGGFGFVGAGYEPPDSLTRELGIARQLLQHTDDDAPLPIGVGFLAWQLEKSPDRAEQLLSIVLEHRVQAVWLAFGQDLGRWADYVRNHDKNAGSAKAVKIFVQLSTVEQAHWAIKECKADVIVAQGNEAGGHGLGASLPLLTLCPLIADVVKSLNGPPLIAAGGLAIGAQIASLLTLGAQGVVLGTRFLLSPESLYTDSHRQALIAADSSQSVRTMAFDYARNTLGWPEGIDGRGLRNGTKLFSPGVMAFTGSTFKSSIIATVVDYERGTDIAVIQKKLAEAIKTGDNTRMVVWAGSGVGLMTKTMPAQDIVNELHEECVRHLRGAGDLVVNA
ncbi:unnamed protein product [Cyclocybe aegerita]|uniref:2-nitropropane dioxygenase n=1 Tax=Cyclocybe aegerita TaxID=1973307 RepID=A0A8S0WZ09_CYCAE|nr:unnamed protein product [Cyclocybe aegerita]